MKKTVLIFSFLLLCLANALSQANFNTGALQVYVDKYGVIELSTPPDTTYQLDRASILVGTSQTAVFDYWGDAQQHDPTELITNPELSDYEIYGAYDNTYSGAPPDVIVKLNAYGWTDGGYTIIKFNVINDEESAINAVIGLDIIPYLNEVYGFDTVTYNSTEGVIRFHRGADENMGIKLLSASLFSLYSFEWYDDYSVDADYWTWMNTGSLQSEHVTYTEEGTVTITSQYPVTINPGESFDVYYAFALGSDEQILLSNIAEAVQKYNEWFTAVEEFSTTDFNLMQNYPNPFDRSTTIRYQLPENGPVTLQVYDVLGNKVATLINEEQTAGQHMIDFDASGLECGVYYYTIRFNGEVRTNAMMLAQ
ncbi:MAG: T9SS type A sorting domain-containing protein [Bacteroidales bacterium]|nr:T9SS type A sorting domain-containing protein [Lentimicrobiaceae bacterium]MDD5696184.1 T9SS type A sorting domain-containing protein [Bacteroidales bacterium]